jgi:WD40 repeat protein
VVLAAVLLAAAAFVLRTRSVTTSETGVREKGPAAAGLDCLRRQDVPAHELAVAGGGDPAQAPPQIVAILGDSRLRHWATVEALGFGPEGKTFVSQGKDGTARIWDMETGKELLALPARVLAVSRDGRTMAVDGPEGEVRFRDLAAGKELPSLRTHGGPVERLALGADGRLLAAGSGGWVKVWELPAGKEKPHAYRGTLAALSPDGRLLAVCPAEGTLELHEVATGKEQATLALGKGKAAAAFSPDGRTLAGWTDASGAVTLWDAAAGHERHRIEAHGWYVHDAVFSPDGKTLATAGHDGVVKLWDVKTARQLRQDGRYDQVPSRLAFSPDGKTLAGGGYWDATIHFWEADTGLERQQPRPSPHSYLGAALSPDGRTLVLGRRDGAVLRWQPGGGREPGVLACHTGLWGVRYSPDGRHLATSGFDGAVRLWDAATGEARLTVPGGNGNRHTLALSPDGTVLATINKGRHEDHVHLWDVAGARELRTAGEDGLSLTQALAFSPDGRLLATGCRDGRVALWDAGTGTKRRLWKIASDKDAESLFFSPDGTLLASRHVYENATHLSDAARGAEVRTIPQAAAGFTPDGKRLVAAAEGRLHFWDPHSGVNTPQTILQKSPSCSI